MSWVPPGTLRNIMWRELPLPSLRVLATLWDMARPAAVGSLCGAPGTPASCIHVLVKPSSSKYVLDLVTCSNWWNMAEVMGCHFENYIVKTVWPLTGMPSLGLLVLGKTTYLAVKHSKVLWGQPHGEGLRPAKCHASELESTVPRPSIALRWQQAWPAVWPQLQERLGTEAPS